MTAFLAALSFVAVLLVALPAVVAQDAQMQGLIDRIDRLQRELSTLQRQVYRGESPPPTDTPVEGQVGGDVSPTTALARIELRLSQVENEMRSLTGQIEEAAFRYNQVGERLDRLAADLELRLQRLEQATPGLATAPGMPGTLGSPGTAASLAPLSGTPPAAPGTPGVLGTIDPAQLQALRAQHAAGTLPPASEAAAQRAAAPAALSGGTPKEQYDHAFGLLSQANYNDAEVALRTFIEQNPKDPLAGNAKYWLGETFYVRGDFQQAAVTFAEAYQEFPDNSKAPDNLLKLGLALAALGNKADACGTLTELLKRYKDAAVTVTQRAKQEQQRLGC